MQILSQMKGTQTESAERTGYRGHRGAARAAEHRIRLGGPAHSLTPHSVEKSQMTGPQML